MPQQRTSTTSASVAPPSGTSAAPVANPRRTRVA